MAHRSSKLASVRPTPWAFVLLWIVELAAFWKPAHAAFTLSLGNQLYSHLVLIPFITGALIYFHRATIIQESRSVLWARMPLFALAVILYWLAWPWSPSAIRSDVVWLPILALVVLWVATFFVLQGPKAFMTVLFPLCFLVLLVPIPSTLVDRAVVALQTSSAEVTYVLFKVLGIPVFRQGFQFSLPGFTIEVAQECSGIHSAVALLIAGLLASHLLLRATWKQILFVLLTIPVAILKNGLRIVLLSSLGLYVDRSYLDGALHHHGGPIFALLGLAIMLPILLLLRRSEVRREDASAAPAPYPRRL